jgi:hypothetical protein
VPRPGSTDVISCRPVALPQPQRSTTGTYTLPSAYAIGVSTPPSSPGQTVTRRRGSGPRSFLCNPTTAVQRRRRVARSHAITRPPLPASMTRLLPPTAARIGVAWKS